jgi:dolichol-phosphate mannosyltransferase
MKEQRSKVAKSNGRVLVFTATYNEKDNVQKLCPEILALPDAYDMLVVDDGSPDGTGQILDTLSAANPRLKVIHRKGKLGLGSAHKLAIQYAMDEKYDVLVTMDADFSHKPQDIPRLIEALGNDAGFVIGSRYAKGGQCDYTGYRKFVSTCANISSRALLGVPLTEYTTSFRAFRVSDLRKVDLNSIQSQGYSFFLESTFRVHQSGVKLREIPIHFKDRVHGESKIPRSEIFRGASKLVSLFADRLRGRKAPRRGKTSGARRAAV